MEFFASVVLYNTTVNESDTIKQLSAIQNHCINIIVLDNSTIEMGNQELCEKNGWQYISLNGNAGLSKAYNAALDHLKHRKGIVIWFDDDTKVTQEYFDVLEHEATVKQHVDIFAPMIRGQDGKFWSPNEYGYIRNRQLKNRNDSIDASRFNAINSCTAVRLEVYEDYRYTEELFLDQVDHQFFEDQRGLGRRFEKLNVIIHHNFSIKSKMNDIEAVKRRYSIMIPDFLVFCNKSKSRYFLGLIKILGWGIKESLKYQRVDFFFWCIGTVKKSQKRIV